MPFGTIVGHRHVLKLVSRAVARQSLPPSLLLTGPQGVGKRRVAIALAQVLNCLTPVTRDAAGDPSARAGAAGDASVRAGESKPQAPKDLRGNQSGSGFRSQAVPGNHSRTDLRFEVDACGVCAACRRIDRGMHPDVMLVGPEDDASSIKVEQARDIGEHAAYRPYEGRRRVVIIDPADAMERFAQNALLKLLEEPPPATIFVLVTSQPDLLLPTVRSRCPQIRFGPLTVGEIADVLVRERHLPVEEARAAAVLASGSVSRALESAADDSSGAREQALHVLRDAANTGDRQSLVERMKLVLGVEKRQGTPAAERERLSVALRALASMLRDLALLASARAGAGGTAQAGPDSQAAASGLAGLRELANADLQHDLEPLVGRFGRERLMRAYSSVDCALGALRHNTSPKLVVDWLAYQL